MDWRSCGSIRLRWAGRSLILLFDGLSARWRNVLKSWVQCLALFPKPAPSLHCWANGQLHDIHGDVGAGVQHCVYTLNGTHKLIH